jgi:hypothetical protein
MGLLFRWNRTFIELEKDTLYAKQNTFVLNRDGTPFVLE